MPTLFKALRGLQIARYAMGKYIILFACFLHLAWAGLLSFDQRAGNATPVSVLFALLHNRALIVVTLISVSIFALAFLSIQLRQKIKLSFLTALLVPQQIVLWSSAGAGVYAVSVGHYADGFVASWPHILADQLPNILTALLYTVALVETMFPPIIIPVALKEK